MPSILNSVLKSIDNCSSFRSLKQAHAHAIIHGLCRSNLVAVKLVVFSNRFLGCLSYARLIFNFLSSIANVYLWTATITCYSRQNSKLAREAILIYRSMLEHGVSPNNFTLSAILKACSTLNSPVEGKQVHAHSAKLGFDSSIYIQTALVDMYAKSGCVEDARFLFDNTTAKNVVMSNCMIACHVKSHDIKSAREVFDEMPQRDAISFATLISGYAANGDSITARILFDQMHVKEVSCWNAMIVGYCHDGELDQTVKLLNEMQRNTVKPDKISMVILVSTCGQFGALRIGKQLHALLHKTIIDIYINNSLVDMYAKCGSILEAYNVFSEMEEKDLVSYNIMINGLSNHGLAKYALNLFSTVVDLGMKPDEVTFLGVLTACSQNGLLELSLRYFGWIPRPSVDHYTCIVDLFGRSGLVEAAYQLVRSMPVEPHAGVWGALLNACYCYCHVPIGRIAAEELFRIEPENSGNYVLLSNIYARAQLWESVGDMRGLMRRKGVGKAAGCSWIELNNEVYHFVMGDELNPNLEQIYEVLGNLYLQLMVVEMR